MQHKHNKRKKKRKPYIKHDASLGLKFMIAIQGESGNLQVTGTYQVIVPIASNLQMPTM